MILIVELDYTASNIIKKLPRDRYTALRDRLEQLGLEEWREDKEEKPYWYTSNSRFLVQFPQDAMTLDEFELPYKVVKFRNTYRVEDPDTHQHVHVHIPNFGLLAIREVTNLDDACTDTLQRYLDEGWSILAICPPNATRRPDYILGRADKR